MTEQFSPEQLRQLETVVRKAVREEMGDAGLRLDDAEHQDKAREDFRFVRRVRLAAEGVAGKVGGAVLLAVVGGAIWLVSAGINAWKSMP